MKRLLGCHRQRIVAVALEIVTVPPGRHPLDVQLSAGPDHVRLRARLAISCDCDADAQGLEREIVQMKREVGPVPPLERG